MNMGLMICLAAATMLCPAEPSFAGAAFQLIPIKTEIPERGIVVGFSLVVPGGTFSFLPPDGARVFADPHQRTLILTGVGNGAKLTIKLLDPKPEHGQFSRDELLNMAMAQTAGAEMVHEFPCYTSGEPGVAFDFAREIISPVKQGPSMRIAFVPYSKGLVQIELDCSPENFGNCHKLWTFFLNSFRFEPASKPHFSHQQR